MKKNLFLVCGATLLSAVLILSACQKKSDSGISPSYKEEQGTGGNPFPNNPTVTGSPDQTNPATQPSSLLVGGGGWSNPTCASTLSVTLKGINGTVDVTLNFFAPPTTGTYNIGATPTQSQTCSMTVSNAPNQPAGIIWYAKSGIVSVTTSTNPVSITAAFSGIVCTQQNFNFPTVTVTGQLGCN